MNQIAALNIRRLDAQRDRAAIARLAQLDSTATPVGDLLGAEVEGRVVAAISLETGRTLADPFARTAELRSMLELRAAQLGARNRGRRPLLGRLARSGQGQAHAALTGSPPGAGGRLLTLPR